MGKHIRTRRVGVHSLITFRLGAPNILPSMPITVYGTAFDFEMSEIFFSLTEPPPPQTPKVKESQKLLLLYEHIPPMCNQMHSITKHLRLDP